MKPCPKCGKYGMPRWNPGPSAETARCCQLCGHIEELRTANDSGVSLYTPPEAA